MCHSLLPKISFVFIYWVYSQHLTFCTRIKNLNEQFLTLQCRPPSFGEAHFIDVNLDQYENYLPIPPGETVRDKTDKSYIINAIFQSMLGDIEKYVIHKLAICTISASVYF